MKHFYWHIKEGDPPPFFGLQYSIGGGGLDCTQYAKLHKAVSKNSVSSHADLKTFEKKKEKHDKHDQHDI